MGLQKKDRAQLVKLFYENGDCALAALKKFCSLKGPVVRFCQGSEEKFKFEKVGSFEVKSDRRRKSIASMLIEDAVTELLKGKNNGVQMYRAW